MKLEYNIRSLYTPVQPAVIGTNGEVSYIELPPDAQLQDFIYCYWNLKTIKPLDDIYNYRVVADGCIDIVFNCTNYDETYIMGYCNSFVKIGIDKEFNYFGIRLLPGMNEWQIAIALEDYSAYELLVNQDEIVIGSRCLNGWLWCRKENSTKEGWVPIRCLKRSIESL